MAEVAVALRDLRKRYGDIEAVRGLTFEVERGEIFGFIGPDGAGKTTTFQILAGVMNPTSGRAEVFGQSARDARLRTGYLTQGFTLYHDLTVMENIRYIGDLRLAPRETVVARGRHYLQLFGMAPFEDRLAGNLSGGMQKKLALACALVPQPNVLLLDEPTTGVDPVSRREFWDSLARLSDEGLTILVATPYLDEAERCNRVAFMHLGEIKELDTPDRLRTSMHAHRLELYLDDLRHVGAAVRAIEARPGVIDVQRFGDRLDVLAEDARVEVVERDVISVLAGEGIAVGEVRTDEPTLENVFVASIRATDPAPPCGPFPMQRPPVSATSEIAIGAAALTKRFGTFTAVDRLSLDVRFGEIYGLLGANGAGKTTTIRMLCGLLAPTQGTTTLAGVTGNVRSPDVRRRVGYMSQKFSLYDDLTIAENLEFFAGVYGVPPGVRSEKIAWVLEFAGLRGKEDEITGSLPGGWKQRVAFGSAIMHEPTVLFLDEPTSGVDPIARRAFWGMIDQLAESGTAVLVTTHYLEEAEQCNRLGFMAAGKLIEQGTPTEVKSRQRGSLLEARVRDVRRALDVLHAAMDRRRVSLFGDRLHVVVDGDPQAAIRDLSERLEKAGCGVIGVRQAQFSLEDVFIGAVERVGTAA
ncbi:MAG: ABC transporter ATP-binding protein [Candidatus Eremiobacteraeota bacterium]|nr:ABC transporter ATP-binding protein [Candidatus Eremiobacteraeota bacterium]MBV8654777.1 ABC transporter ATP-binding protein [Candidatus Eremiobacteraeota bacterium]